MCDGKKAKAPMKDCQSPVYETSLHVECHGRYDCLSQVPVNSQVCGRGYKTEMNVSYSCVQCYPWHQLITKNDDCVETLLYLLKRLEKQDFDIMPKANKVFVLKQFVVERLDETFYTQSKLLYM